MEGDVERSAFNRMGFIDSSKGKLIDAPRLRNMVRRDNLGMDDRMFIGNRERPF